MVKEKDEIIAELQQNRRTRHNQSSDVEVEGHGKFTEKDSTDETSRYEINRKARIAAKNTLITCLIMIAKAGIRMMILI